MKADRSSFKSALMLMTGRAAAFALTFIVPVVLVRLFTQEEFGTYKQFFLITYTLYSIGQLGLAECLFYFIPQNPEAGGRYALNSVLMLTGVGIACFVALQAFSVEVGQWLSNPGLSAYVPLIGLYLIPLLMGTALEITMVNCRRYRLATVTYVVSDLLRGALLVVPAYLTGSLRWALIGGIAYCVIRVFAVFGYLYKEFGTSVRFDSDLLRQQLAYALPFALSILVYTIQANYHQYAVSSYFDAVTFAIYSVGCLQIPLVDFMATPASNVLMVRMGEAVRQKQTQELLPAWHEHTQRMALMFFPFVGLLVVSADRLIRLLFTDAYAAAVPVFMVWSISFLFLALQTDAVLRVYAELRFLFISNLVRLIVIVGLMGWFLSYFHLVGAVLVTIIGTVVAKAMALVRMKSLMHARFVSMLPWRGLASISMAAMLAAVPSLILNAKLDLSALYVLPVSGLAYMGSFTVLILLFRVLTEAEKQVLKRSLYVWNRRPDESGREAGI